MSLLKNYNIRSKGYITEVICLLAVAAVAYVVSKVVLNTILLLVLITSVFLLYLFLKDNLSFFFLALYGLLIGIPWGRTGQSQGKMGWGAPSGDIFGIRIEYTHILTLFFLFFVAIKIILKERERLMTVPNFRYFSIFIIIVILSATLGLNHEEGLLYAIKYVTIPMLGGFLMAFWVTSDERSFKTLTLGIILLTTAISLYAIFEFIVKKNPIEIFTLAHLPIAPGETIETYKNIKSNTYRSNATLGNPILAAFTLLAGFMLSTGYYIYYRQEQKQIKSIIALLALVINFLGIVTTFSRGIIFVSIIIFIIFMLPYLKKRSSIIVFISLAISLICILNFGMKHYQEQDVLLKFDYKYILEDSSYKHRINAYSATYYVLKSWPFLGSGFVSMDEITKHISVPVFLYIKTLDNTFLEILVFSGLFGFISFVLLLLKYVWDTRRALNDLKYLNIYPVLSAMYCGIIGMLLASLEFWSFGQQTCSLTFWTFVGILASITLTDVKCKFKGFNSVI